MNFGDMKAQVKSILHRSDVTDAQLSLWVNTGLTRLDVDLRIPPSERTYTVTVTDPAGQSEFAVPSDYMEMINVEVDGVPIERLGINQLASLRSNSDPQNSRPRYYARKAGNFILWPSAGTGTAVEFYYYGDSTKFTLDAQESTMSAVHPWLFIFAALVLACEWAQDEREDKFQAKRDRYASELISTAVDEELSGGGMCIQPAYSTGSE